MSPGGGPKDLKPPLLISTSPVELVNIKDNQEISIIFDEYINEGSIKKSLSIFPKNQDGIDFSYEGKIIRVKIPSDLDPNMTYTINFNKNFSDENNVKINEDIVIPFSFSDNISSGKINGQIFGDFENVSILIWNGIFSGEIINDLKPDYVISANKQFSFNHLPNGDFSLIAVNNYRKNEDLTSQNISLNKSFHFNIEDNNSIISNFYFNKNKVDEIETENSEELNSKYSSLSGRIVGNYLLPMVVTLSGDKNYSTNLGLDGKFNFEKVNEGKYEMIIFEDRNNNRILDTGSLENSTDTENFHVYGDILELRSNWEFEIPNWNINE